MADSIKTNSIRTQYQVSYAGSFYPFNPDSVVSNKNEITGAYEGLIYWNKTTKKIEVITKLSDDGLDIEGTTTIPDASALAGGYLSKDDYIDRYQNPSYTSGLQISTATGDATYNSNLYVPKATESNLGVIKLKNAPKDATIPNATETANRFYPLQTTSAGIAYVNVPWTNHITSVNGLSGGTISSNVTVDGSVIAKAFYESSDERYKTEIKSIIDTENIPDLKSFVWKDTSVQSYGFIAQEVEQVYPELVVTKEDGFKSVNYDAALCLVVGKLKKEIEILKEKVAKLEA